MQNVRPPLLLISLASSVPGSGSYVVGLQPINLQPVTIQLANSLQACCLKNSLRDFFWQNNIYIAEIIKINRFSILTFGILKSVMKSK